MPAPAYPANVLWGNITYGQSSMSRIDTIAQDKRKQLAELETMYLRAMEELKSKDFQDAQLRALKKIRTIIRLGIVEEGQALQILGRIQQVLLDTYEAESVVAEYESLKKSLAEMYPGEK